MVRRKDLHCISVIIIKKKWTRDCEDPTVEPSVSSSPLSLFIGAFLSLSLSPIIYLNLYIFNPEPEKLDLSFVGETCSKFLGNVIQVIHPCFM
jgi:hypothetical protein